MSQYKQYYLFIYFVKQIIKSIDLSLYTESKLNNLILH